MKYYVHLILVAITISSLTHLNAQKMWDGEGDGVSWSDQTNWSDDTRPGPFDSVVIDLNAHVIADSTIHFAGSIRIGPMDTLSMLGPIEVSNRMLIDTQGVFQWLDFDLNWPKIDNYGQILLFEEDLDRLESGIRLINHVGAHIIAVDNRGISIDTGTIINYGTFRYNSPLVGGLLSSSNAAKFINKSTGKIIFSSDASSYSINTRIDHYGLIQVDSNTLNITDTTKLFDQCEFECWHSGTILLKSDLLSINGLAIGNILGEIEIQCPFESRKGRLGFTGSGIKWTNQSFINGDTLFNDGLLLVEGNNNNFIRDSGVIFNRGIVDFPATQGFLFIDGEFINDNRVRYYNTGRVDVIGNGANRYINTANGLLRKFSGSNTLIECHFENQGTITSFENEIRFSNDTYVLNEGTKLITTDSSKINFISGQINFNTIVTGDASGQILINTNWTSNNGGADFEEDGFIWRSQSFINGGTFTNYGEMHLGDDFKFLKDSTTLHNKGTLISDINGNLWFEDGRLINDSIIEFYNDVSVFLNGGNQHLIINNPGASIFADGWTVASEIENKGTLHAIDGNVALNGLKKFYDQSELFTTDSSGIFLQTGGLELTGQINGTAPTPITLNCNVKSNDATLNVGGEGIHWQGGTIEESDTLTNNGMLSISTGSNHVLQDSVVLVNHDTIRIPNISTIRINNGLLYNRGYIDLEGSGAISFNFGDYHEVINAANGDIDRTSGTVTSVIKPNLRNFGTIQVQEGTIDFQGDFTNNPTGLLTGIGKLKFADPYLNSGTTSPGLSPGELTFDNTFLQDSTGILEIELNGLTAGTEYDQIIAPFVNLSGNISIDLGFTPTVGDIFNIIDAAVLGVQICNVPDTIVACGVGGRFAVHCLSDLVQLEYVGPGTSGGDVLPASLELPLDSMSGLASLSENNFEGLCGVDSIEFDQTSFNCDDADTVVVSATVYQSGIPSVESVDIILIKPMTTTIWVNAGATGSGFGLSPAHAFTNLSQALIASNGCISKLRKIKLTEGTYVPDNMGNNTRSSSFVLPDSIELKGGYAADGSSQDPATYPTILSGDIGTMGVPTDNVYHVVTISNGHQSTSLHSVTISGGRADVGMDDQGAGLWVMGTCYMERVTIEDNFAAGEGSAIYVTAPKGDLTFGPKNIIMPHNGQSVLFIEEGGKAFINPENRVD